VRGAGLIPFAWQVVHCDDPKGEARVVIQTADAGYEGIVLDVSDRAAEREAGAKELGRLLLDAGLNPRVLYYSGFPNISQQPGIPYVQLNVYCRGGFMSRSFPSLEKPAEVVIHKMTYEEHAKWTRRWGDSVPLYPVLAAFGDERGADRLAVNEFGHWVRVLATHTPSFVSIFCAESTDREYWPTLADLAVPRPPRAVIFEPTVLSASTSSDEAGISAESVEQAVYVVVQPDDTVLWLCQEYDSTRSQFWEWNGYLWDGRGLPRDPDYMQAGWRVRVK
jgi:hypothetical protein